jgi:cytochrome d ubiquinol oxidase subunit II
MDTFFNVAWYVVLAIMLTGYAILDGFDLGVGGLHLLVARNEKERSTSINAIGPVWNGNEVWLLAAGGSMVVAFPHLYASGFSGFYLALMLVLWLLVLRGVGIEFRHQMSMTIWREAWDVVFCFASLLLSVLFGVAVGNVLVGVPFGPDGRFQGSFAVLLNWFAILGGLLSLSVLLLHGANYLAMKTEGTMQDRARRYARVLFWIVVALLAAVTVASFVVRPGPNELSLRPDFLANFLRAPVLFVFTLLGIASVATMFLAHRNNRDRMAFLSGAGLIISILASVAAGLFPWLLPSSSQYPGLTIINSASSENSQRVAFFIYLFGIAVVLVYLIYVYRSWAGKADAHGNYDN